MITVKEELDFNDLLDKCWSGAVSTLETIFNQCMVDEFMDWLADYYGDETPTLTELNDLLRFEDDFIFRELGIEEEEE